MDGGDEFLNGLGLKDLHLSKAESYRKAMAEQQVARAIVLAEKADSAPSTTSAMPNHPNALGAGVVLRRTTNAKKETSTINNGDFVEH